MNLFSSIFKTILPKRQVETPKSRYKAQRRANNRNRKNGYGGLRTGPRQNTRSIMPARTMSPRHNSTSIFNVPRNQTKWDGPMSPPTLPPNFFS